MTRPHQRSPFKRPEQAVVWAACLALDIPLLHEVLCELATEEFGGHETQNPAGNEARALRSLRLAYNIFGRPFTQGEYRRLETTASDLDLLADSTLRRYLGNLPWSQCLSRALIEAPSDGDFSSAPHEGAFTEQELLDSIAGYADDHDGQIPTLYELLAWDRLPTVVARPGRRPRSSSPFDRLGGYPEFLKRHGLLSKLGARVDIRGRRLPISYSYGREDLSAAVREVEARLGHPPRETEYDRERQKIHDEAAEAGSGRVLPGSWTLRRAFRAATWTDVLAAAGGSKDIPRHPRGGNASRPKYSREEKLAWLRRAWVAVGEPFTQSAYEAWRRVELDKARERGEELSIPSGMTIYRICGTWAKAREAALPEAQAGVDSDE